MSFQCLTSGEIYKISISRKYFQNLYGDGRKKEVQKKQVKRLCYFVCQFQWKDIESKCATDTKVKFWLLLPVLREHPSWGHSWMPSDFSAVQTHMYPRYSFSHPPPRPTPGLFFEIQRPLSPVLHVIEVRRHVRKSYS